MWHRCLVMVCMAVSLSLAMTVPSTGAAGADAPSYLNPALVQVGQVAGQIVDVSETQILYLDRSASQVMLKVLDRATGQTVTVPAVPDRDPVYGWLVPGGVIFHAEGADVTTDRLYEWYGGSAVTDLGPLNSTYSVIVRAPYVIWSDGSTLYRRDVATRQTAVVATDAGNWNNDVLQTGEVIYWSNSYRIMRYLDGQTEQVSPDTPGLWNVYPITDGSNVVYRRGTPCCGDQTYSIVLNHGGTETELTPSSSFEPSPGMDYEVAGGWTAFQKPSSTGGLQTWLRDPSGPSTQLPDIAPTGRPEIVAMNAGGQVLYSSGENLYLGQTGQPAVLLASGQGAWETRRFPGPGNFATYLGQQWYLAIGGSLYALSNQPLATLNITVQGHGTVSIAPYGTICRNTCSVRFAPGAELDLTATADLPGWRFTQWQGACSGSSVACQLRLDATTSVSAVFHHADTTVPTTTPPATHLRPGTQLSSGVPPTIPVTTSWTAADPDDPVGQEDLQVSVNGGGYAPVSLPSVDATHATSAVVPTARYEFRARAVDSHGNVGNWTNGKPFTVDTAQETSATFTGAWAQHHSRTAWGGTTISTTSATASATINTNSQEFAIVGPTGPRNGSMQICVDGTSCQTIPTRSTNRLPRIILADVSLTPGSHTIRITRAPTSHGKIELDGFIALR